MVMDYKRFPHILLFLLGNFLALLWMLSQNLKEFSIQEIITFFLYAAAILFTQVAVMLALDKVSLRFPWSKVAAGLFTALNVYTLILVHNSHFSGLSTGAVMAVIAGLSVGFSAVYLVPSAVFQKAARVFSIIMIVAAGVQLIKDMTDVDSYRSIPENIQIPEFTKRPNIYIVTFDTMSPESVIRKNVGLDGVSYDDETIKSGGRIIPNTFAEQIPTKMSLNLLYALDMDYFNSLKKKNALISNEAGNPVYEIFRKNGYSLQFMYESAYFGRDMGRLDYYGIAKVNGVCTHIEKKYALMGYCFENVQAALKSLAGVHDKPYPELLFERIKEVSKSGKPWFTHAHIYQPGHAKNSFNPRSEADWAEFRDLYQRRSEKATRTLQNLIATIKENDPDAVLIIFGDHGALTSRTLLDDADKILPDALAYNPDNLAQDSPLTYEQIVQDRHAVLNAVFPKTFCREGFNHNPYSTSRIMRDLIMCLSDGHDPLPENMQPDDGKWKPYLYQ